MYNDNIAIENFITYCDDMLIAEEGFSIKDLFADIKTAIENAWKWFVEKVKYIKEKISSKIHHSSQAAQTSDDDETTTSNQDVIKVKNMMNEMLSRFDNIKKHYESKLKLSLDVINEIDKLKLNSRNGLSDTEAIKNFDVVREKISVDNSDDLKKLEEIKDEIKKHKSAFSNSDLLLFSNKFQKDFNVIYNSMSTIKEKTISAIFSIKRKSAIKVIQINKITATIKTDYMTLQSIALNILNVIANLMI